MAKSLVLCEKPSQGQDIANGLGVFRRANGYLDGEHHIITWGFGHLVELKDAFEYDEKFKKWRMEDLPIIPNPFEYKPTDGGRQQLEVIKRLLHDDTVDNIIIAGDPGREGELIARLILLISDNTKPVFRFWTSKALTPEVVKKEFENLKPSSEYDRLYEAALCRQQADWLVGINGSRAITVQAGTTLTVGRVQTPVLRIIVEREEAIQAFKPDDFWVISSTFEHENGKYEGTLLFDEEGENGDSKTRIPSEDKGAEIMSKLEGMGAKIVSATRKKKVEKPPLLFSLNILQQEANRLFGFPADKTLELAQKLYSDHKIITYPRTESQHLNTEMSKEVKSILMNMGKYEGIHFDFDKCVIKGNNKRIFDDAKLSDHHALIPTGKVKPNISEDEKKLFKLVASRFICVFYPDSISENTSLVTATECGTYKFQSSGTVLKEKGWKAVYGSLGKERLLPLVSKNDPVVIISSELEKKQTKPPSRYTDATILNAMENAARFLTDKDLRKILRETAGLGTAATRADILKKLENRGFISRKGRSLIPMIKGIDLIKAVRNEKVSDVAYTALWEQELDDIARGDGDNIAFMDKIYEYSHEIVAALKNKPINFTRKFEKINDEVLGNCPACGASVLEYKKNYACSAHVDGCKFAIWKNALSNLGKGDLLPAHIKAFLDGKSIRFKQLKSKAGKEFNAIGMIANDEQYGWKISLTFE